MALRVFFVRILTLFLGVSSTLGTRAAFAENPQKYVDLVLLPAEVGDNVILNFPYIAVVYADCERRGLGLRISVPNPVAAMLRRNAPPGVVIQEFPELIGTEATDDASLAKVFSALHFPANASSCQELIVSEYLFNMSGNPDTAIYLKKLQDYAARKFSIEAARVGIFRSKKIRISRKIKKNTAIPVSNIYEDMDTSLSDGADLGPIKLTPLDHDAVSTLRAEVGQWLLPRASADVAAKRVAELFPAVRRDYPVIVFNLETGKGATSLLRSKGLVVDELREIRAHYGDRVNIVIPHISGTYYKNQGLRDEIEKEIAQAKAQGVVAILDPADTKNGTLDALVASPRCVAVISGDTGFSHVAAILRSDRPASVHTIFTSEGALAYELERWRIPGQQSYHELDAPLATGEGSFVESCFKSLAKVREWFLKRRR